MTLKRVEEEAVPTSNIDNCGCSTWSDLANEYREVLIGLTMLCVMFVKLFIVGFRECSRAFWRRNAHGVLILN